MLQATRNGASNPRHSPTTNSPTASREDAKLSWREGAERDTRASVSRADEPLESAPDLTYASSTPVTRAGFAWRLLGRPRINAEQAMLQASLKGWFHSLARPHEAITRAEAAACLLRVANFASESIAERVYYFADVFASGESWIFEAAHRARLCGIFQGTTDNRFDPKGTLDGGIAQTIIGRTLSAQVRTKEQQREHLTVEPLSEPSSWLPYPGPDGAASAKYAFYMQVLERTGHGGIHEEGPHRYSLIGIRGFRQGDLAEMKYNGNAGNEYNDLLVVVGHDEQSKAVVKEFPGATEPGVAKQWALEAGVYEYAYEKSGFTSVTGNKVDGSYFRMTRESAANFSTIKDRNGDRKYDKDGGDTADTEQNNRKYLIHRGGKDAAGKVGEWSYGCQVFAGQTDGRLNVDVAADFLKQNPDKLFKYVLIDGRHLEKAAKG